MAQTAATQIDGVRTRVVRGFADEGGMMGGAGYVSSDKDWFVGYGDLLLMTLNRGAVRPFHYHKHGTDTMAAISGSARVVLYDMREESPTKGQIQEIVLEAKGGDVTFLQVPPLVAHAFQGASDQAVLVDLASSVEQSGSDFLYNDPGSVPYEFK